MTSWRDEYIQALQDRDVREQASYQKLDADLIAACKIPTLAHILLKLILTSITVTNLLDRTAELEADKASNLWSSPAQPESKASRDSPQPAGINDGTGQLRRDLAETLRSNGQLQTRIKNAEVELVKLRAKSRAETKQVEELSRERAYLAQKLKDRDEELRGKTKLLDVGSASLARGPFC